MASLTDVVRGKVKADGRTIYAIAKASGLDASHLARFMVGKGGLTSASMDRLWETLRMGAAAQRADIQPTQPDTAPRVATAPQVGATREIGLLAPHHDRVPTSTPSPTSFRPTKFHPQATKKLRSSR